MDAADSENCRVYRMVFAGDYGLELGENVSADGDRVDAVFRMSTMAALAAYLDVINVTGCACRAFFYADGADGESRSYMETGKYVRF